MTFTKWWHMFHARKHVEFMDEVARQVRRVQFERDMLRSALKDIVNPEDRLRIPTYDEDGRTTLEILQAHAKSTIDTIAVTNII